MSSASQDIVTGIVELEVCGSKIRIPPAELKSAAWALFRAATYLVRPEIDKANVKAIAAYQKEAA